MFKNIFPALLALFLIAACDSPEMENPGSSTPSPDEEVVFGENELIKDEFVETEDEEIIKNKFIENEIDTNDWKICENEILGIRLRYPPNWGECFTTKEDLVELENNSEYLAEDDFNFEHCSIIDGCFFFRTSNTKYEVYLSAFIEKNNHNSLQWLTVNDRKNANPERIENHYYNYYTKVKDGEVFRVNGVGGGTLDAALLDRDLFEFSWRTLSNEPMPKDPGGIWQPEDNVLIEENWIWRILKTIELIQ